MNGVMKGLGKDEDQRRLDGEMTMKEGGRYGGAIGFLI